jgi:hypothetical protein
MRKQKTQQAPIRAKDTIFIKINYRADHDLFNNPIGTPVPNAKQNELAVVEYVTLTLTERDSGLSIISWD